MIIYPHTHRSDIGKTVVPGPGSFLGNGGLGSFGLYLSSAGKFVPVRLVKLADIPREVADILGNEDLDGSAVPVGFRDSDGAPGGTEDDMRKSWGPVVDLKKLAGAADGDVTPRDDVWRHAVRRPEKGDGDASEAGSTNLRPPDLRVLYIDMDDTGMKYKELRKVILESKTLTYAGVPLEGPLSALNCCRHTHRFGGSPRLWFTEFAGSKGIHSTDRVYHELSTLVDAVYHGGTYDQYNLGCSICIEVICRRIQSIIDAYSNPGRIDFTQARHFVGTGSLEDAIDPALRNYVARKSKDETEIQNARDKARSLAPTSGPAAASSPSYPSAPGPTKPKRKARPKGAGAGEG